MSSSFEKSVKGATKIKVSQKSRTSQRDNVLPTHAVGVVPCHMQVAGCRI